MIQKFLDYMAIERKCSQRTVEAYQTALREFCEFMGMDTESFNPEGIDETDIKTWVYNLAEKRKNAPRSVHMKMSALRSFYRYLLRRGYVTKDITQRVILPKLDKPLPKFFKPQEMEAFEQISRHELEAVGPDDFTTIRDRLIIEILYQTGMRQAELIGLTDADWDMEEGSVRIFGKRRKERIVPVGQGLIDQIREYMKVRDKLLDGQNTPAFIIRRKKNGEVLPMSSQLLYNIVHTRMGEVSTQQKRSPHVLRHTFATTMLNNGADIRTIQELLGHANLRATQIYTHATFSELQKVYEKSHPRAKKSQKKG